MLLYDDIPEGNQQVSRMLPLSDSSLDLTEPKKDSPFFMPHPTDRFLMLLALAVQRRPFIGTAFCQDETAKNLLSELIADVDAGRFDRLSAAKEGRPFSPLSLGIDKEQRQWRSTTCKHLRMSILQDRHIDYAK